MVFDIVTFGSAVVDTFIDTEFNEKTKSFNYPAGSKILAHSMKSDIGGGATNTAVAFSRFGFKTGCICKIGNDNAGEDILRMLKKEKIKFLGSRANSPTGHSIILDSKSHSRTILTYKGIADTIKPKEIQPFDSKWLYFSSAMKDSLKSQESLAKKLCKTGTKLALNPTEYVIKNVDISNLLKLTDILILNKEEAELLCKKYKTGKDIFSGLRKLGPKIVVITDKNNPVYAYGGNKKYSIIPNKKIKVVERTGAGDAFAAGFVSGVMAKMNLQECLELGVKESESVIQYFGAKNKLLKMKLK